LYGVVSISSRLDLARQHRQPAPRAQAPGLELGHDLGGEQLGDEQMSS
jgi:hypothetical protein